MVSKDIERVDKIQEELKTMLSEKRYHHSIGTMKMAEELARQYGIDTEEAGLAGLVHDMAKELTEEESLKYMKENNIEIDEIEQKNAKLLHAKIGADMAKKRYGFPENMQKAILYHTTAYPEMDMLAKIIFIADKAEENRKYEEVETVRNLAKKDLDECILYILNFTIKANIDKEKLVHPNSFLTRNQLLMNKNSN